MPPPALQTSIRSGRSAGRRVAASLAALSLASLTGLGSMSAAAAATGGSTPYTDPSATGVIGLCDKAGNQITHGNINTKPFVWRAVSSQAAAPPYDAAGRTATLFAFQPRQDVPAGDWSGDELTASARYSNPAHPMAQATGGDESLRDFMGEFRPMWDGLLQLRIFLGAPGQQGETLTYPATDIKVTGDTWQVVHGGSVSCTSGSAESIETILLPASKVSPGSKHHAKQTAGTSPKATATATPLASAGTDPHPSAVALQTSTGSGGDTAIVVGVVVGAAVVLLAVGYATARRRRATEESK